MKQFLILVILPRYNFLIIVVALLISCDGEEKRPDVQDEHTETQRAPERIVKGIQQEFPGALPYEIAIDSLLSYLASYGIAPEQILWGESTCVDDITNTKNKFIHPEIKGPFTFGGLGGLPFTGETGIKAFAHHVPEDGTALLFLCPHIGYNAVEGWGKILRHGQKNSSACCGAIFAALEKLQKNELQNINRFADDYQEQTIEELAAQHGVEVLETKQPLIALTRIISEEARKRMTSYARKVNERHFVYAVVVIGIVINTDFTYDDYLWIDHIAIKDIKKNFWIKEL
jgi:hypothetical protein